MSTEQVVLNLDEYHILSLAIVSVKKRRMLQMTIVSSTLRNQRLAMQEHEPSPQVCKNALQEIEEILQKLRIGRRQRYEYQIVISCSKEYNNLSKSHLHLLDICKHKEILPCGCRGFETSRFKRLFLDDTSMTENLSANDLLDVCKCVSRDWKQLAIRLGFSLAEIHCIAADNQKIEDAVLQMLVKWKQRQDSNVNILYVMRNALREQGYNRLSEKIGRDNQFSHNWEELMNSGPYE
ncbi:uncharacterized protein LOC117114533 [Anneissia japonica]|uniref:uncharacterized protein LOC117114533 n=1 Tax=Anneissia japonica TaxID=1529436 RepID=UPI0014254B71|nr:uncharacterized protein LOC117114533 [Anneissia japonica]